MIDLISAFSGISYSDEFPLLPLTMQRYREREDADFRTAFNIISATPISPNDFTEPLRHINSSASPTTHSAVYAYFNRQSSQQHSLRHTMRFITHVSLRYRAVDSETFYASGRQRLLPGCEAD